VNDDDGVSLEMARGRNAPKISLSAQQKMSLTPERERERKPRDHRKDVRALHLGISYCCSSREGANVPVSENTDIDDYR
jgi:hypothetical protein